MATKDIAAKPSGRVRRAPLSTRNKLTIANRDPNYHYRIVNVKEDRVEQFLEQGYEFAPVDSVGDKRVDAPSSLGSATEISVGGGMKAVTMRIPKEWYEEDQQYKQSKIDELEATMKSDAAKNK